MRSIIDRDIAHLEESIRALKSRRNELSPISRLPVEILCKIFSLIEDNVSDIFYFKLGRLGSPESWTNFSQVSQHWRFSALSAPELWTKIPLNHPRWAQEMLIRSKMAKLTIRSGSSFEASNPKTIETVRSCLNQMNRVEEIKLTAIPGMILEEIFRDLPKSAPQLRTLCIGIGGHLFRYGGTATGFSIHEDILCDTERLRCVELIKCKISWDSRLLTGLTRLTLEDSLIANSSITQFLHALQRMPALTDLHLKDSIPDGPESLSTYPVVDLPCLRVLNISSSVGSLTAVLRHIDFPHSAILNLTCKENQSTQINFSNFLSVLSTKFLSSLVIRSLSLQSSDVTQTPGLEFCLWTTSFLQDCFPPPSSVISPSQLRLVLTWPSSHRHNHKKALTCALGAMSLPFLTQLQISTEDYIDSQTWVKAFGKLPLLEGVCVKSYSPYSFLDALVYKTKAAEKSKTAYRTVAFPKLRYLHLEGAYFDSMDPTSISVEKLMDYLMERCERKAEVQVLRLDDCYYITYDDVERLEEIVVDVIWDEVEQAVSEEDSEDEREYDSDGNIIDDDYDYSSYDDFPGGFW
jgi:F-box-like